MANCIISRMNSSVLLALALALVVGGIIGWTLAVGRHRVSGPPDAVTANRLAGALDQRAADQATMREGLERLGDQLSDLEHNRVSWQSQLQQQVADLRHTGDSLRRETQTLSTALRKPQVRGRWGEMHLRRAVEVAGLVDRCDFTEQHRLDDGALRPDLVVRLAGGRCVVIDAKVPLDAYLDATGTDDDDEREHHLRRHSAQLRTHIDALGAKRYWRSLPESPEFVVLFVPAESCLAAALHAAPDLIEHAADRQVILASPTTLIALLRTIAHGWSHETLTEQAQAVHELGRDLHARLCTLTGHLDRVGRSLNGAVVNYNQAVGSLESRVLVAARRFEEMSVTPDHLPSPRPVTLHAVTRRADDDGEAGGHTVGA